MSSKGEGGSIPDLPLRHKDAGCPLEPGVPSSSNLSRLLMEGLTSAPLFLSGPHSFPHR